MLNYRKLVVGELATNCYLLWSESKTCVVIDPGDEGTEIAQVINELQIKPMMILLTHGHFDHVLADEDLRRSTGAAILIHAAEKVLIKFPADRYLTEGDIIAIGDIRLKVLHTPGHTPGGICLLGDGFIFTGDTLFLNGIGRTDFEWSSPADMEKSLHRLRDIIKPGMAVYPGHGEIAMYKG